MKTSLVNCSLKPSVWFHCFYAMLFLVSVVKCRAQTPPTITTQPQAQSSTVGGTVSFSVGASAGGGPAVLPSIPSGALRLWLKADAGVATNAAGEIYQWQDASGNSNGAYQTSNNQQPALATAFVPAGSVPAVRFNGIQSFINGDYLHGTNDVGIPNGYTSFLVYSLTDTNATEKEVADVGVPGEQSAVRGYYVPGDLLAFAAWNDDYRTTFQIPPDTYRIWTDRMDTNLSQIEMFDNDGTNSLHFSTPMSQLVAPAPGYYVGGVGNLSSSRNFKGDICELIYYRGTLTDTDRLSVESYLKSKYFTGSSAQLSYQWQFDGTNIAGATNATLVLYNVQLASGGSYTAIAADSAGSVTSAPAVLTVTGAAAHVPSITSFSPAAGAVGATVTIQGGNFSPIAAENIVSFGAVSALVVSATTTQLTVLVPTGALDTRISITANGLVAVSPGAFDVTYAGAGTFGTSSMAAPVSLATGNGPIGVNIVDLDGDGKPDVLVANFSENTISVYRNVATNGSITAASFAPRVSFAVLPGPYQCAIGDLDGDGKPDVVVSGTSVSVFRNVSAPGVFTANSFAPRMDFTVGNPITLVALADMDLDGRLDLVVANSSDDTLSILRNLSSVGNISFAPQVVFSAGNNPTFLSTADLDGDGLPDVVVSENGGNAISIYRNTTIPGSGIISLAPRVDLPTPARPFGRPVIGDLNGDGKPDIAVPIYSGGLISVFQNISTPGAITASSFGPRVDLSAGGEILQVFIADVDGDGRPDLIAASQSANALEVFRNVGTNGVLNAGSFAPRVDFSLGSSTDPVGIAVGDLDGDGRPELVASGNGSSSLAIFRNLNSPAPQITTLQAVPVSAAAGTSVIVPISLIGLGDENAASFSVNFDPSLLSYSNAVPGTGATGAALVANSSSASAGQVGFEIALPAGASFSAGTQQLMQITFQAAFLSNAVTTQITFGDQPITRQVSDAAAHSLPANYLPGSVAIAATQLEGDVSPRTNGDGVVNIFDWVQEGRFVAGLDTISNANEFQRADCAPRATLGDGEINVADWVQVGRYAAGLDPATPAGGPTGPFPNVQSSGGTPHGGSPLPPAQIVSFGASGQGAPPNSVAVELAAQGIENAVSFSVAFDPRAIAFLGAGIGSGAPGAMLNVNSNMASGGKVGCALALPPGNSFAAGVAQVVMLNFASVSYSNTVSLEFGNSPVNLGLADANANSLTAAFQNGTLTLAGLAWPKLNTVQAGNSLVLSWPVSAGGFSVETAPALDGKWTVVAGMPVVSGGNVTITIPLSTSTAFYRLHHQ